MCEHVVDSDDDEPVSPTAGGTRRLDDRVLLARLGRTEAVTTQLAVASGPDDRSYPRSVARYLDVHPTDPQPRAVAQVVRMLREQDALLAYPTDSGYALGFTLDSTTGRDRVRRIRQLDDRHHFSLVCAEFAQLGQFVHLSNSAFRAVKAATPGPYTFILPATREVPRRLAHPRKRTVGVRIPDHPFVSVLLRELGEPLVSSTLMLPGSDVVMTDGWEVKETLEHQVDVVVDAGECSGRPTTVVDWSDDVPQVVRVGAGDPTRFE